MCGISPRGETSLTFYYSRSLNEDTIRVHALASGSSGNSILVQAGATNILIDAGLSERKLSRILHSRGVLAADLDAVLITHEHSDHVAGLDGVARRTGATVIANRPTLEACRQKEVLSCPGQELPTGAEIGVGSIGVRSFPIPHDAVAPVGYALQIGKWKIVYITDAGSVTPSMREALRGANLAIVEANHDHEWLLRGPYTEEMKQRVASPTGHLSNHDCADLLVEHLEEEGAMSIWLAHLSRVNNSPSLARRSVSSRIEAQTSTPYALEVALRDSPSVTWQAGAGAVQLALL